MLVDKGGLDIIGYKWPFRPTDPSAPEDDRLKDLIGAAIRDKRLEPYKHKNLTGIETFYQNLTNKTKKLNWIRNKIIE